MPNDTDTPQKPQGNIAQSRVPEEVPHVEEKSPESTTPTRSQNSAGVLVLQWLTYAFWGWLILGLIWLAWLVFQNAIVKSTVTEIPPYAIAASLVLLPLAFATDLFYRKHEPLKKTGGSAVIMIIHTVLFALLGIIALITTVFTGLKLTIDPTSTSSGIVTLLTAAVAAVLYTATFLRTLNPFKSKKPLAIYSFAFLGVTIILLALTITGPLMRNIETRTDRLIEQNISSINSGVTDYVQENGKLPESLTDITLYQDAARRLIDEGLVTYKKDPQSTQTNASGTTTEHRYQLCTEYKEATSHNDRYLNYNDKSGDRYSSYISSYSHAAGEVCYKLKATTRDDDTK